MSLGGLPTIFPVSFTLDDDGVVLVTGDGAARRAARRGDVVALGADSTEPDDTWAVLAVGRCAEIDDEVARKRYEAMGLVPASGVEEAHYVRLEPEILTGYRAPSG
jgi:hypothetical protein